MAMIKIKTGLDIPLSGAPTNKTDTAIKQVQSVALIGPDYPGMKPTLKVAEGDKVKLGQVLFECKKHPGHLYTAPGAGRVRAIHRGAKRLFLSLVIDLDEQEESEGFPRYDVQAIESLDSNQVEEYLACTGQWTALRQRPYARIPSRGTRPAALFVNAMAGGWYNPDPAEVLRGRETDLALGLQLLMRLGDFPVYVCSGEDFHPKLAENPRIHYETFSGVHPAGLSGTHMHFLAPASRQQVNWWMGVADLVALGRTCASGRLDTQRLVSLSGPGVGNPRLVNTRQGACIADLLEGELNPGAWRRISGSVLSGQVAMGELGWLGRYHHQVSVVQEGGERKILRWAQPGLKEYSKLPVFLSSWLGGNRRYNLNTLRNGGDRAILPIGLYEEVVPLDLLATPLLKALVTGDLELAERLGALELAEEDVALCSFVCPSKYEFGPILRSALQRIEQDG